MVFVYIKISDIGLNYQYLKIAKTDMRNIKYPLELSIIKKKIWKAWNSKKKTWDKNIKK